ncbi:hypothetical protein AA0115_g12780 [Alternaria tenuissima]|uniref:Uncharacterized protein n=1 Tax=Alternaria tenuissima TaxID=119927 RepID=A0AB37VYK3_9PLEO|nr:hypothetical protein AA0115_g12780 [Alternaria tenuissima]
MRRRAAEVEKISQLQKQGAKPALLSIGGSVTAIRDLDDEISNLDLERKSPSVGQDFGSGLQQRTGSSSEPMLETIGVPTGDAIVAEKYADEKLRSRSLHEEISSSGQNVELPHSAVAFVTPLVFIQQFSDTIYKHAGAHHWAEYTRARYSLSDVRLRLEPLVTIYCDSLKTKIATGITSSTDANWENTKLVLLGISLVDRFETKIALEFCSILSSESSSSDPSIGAKPLMKDSPQIFSDWFDHGTESKLRQKRGEPNLAPVMLPSDLIETSKLHKGDATSAVIEAMTSDPGSMVALGNLALDVRRELYNDDTSAMHTIERIVSETKSYHPTLYGYGAEFRVHWSIEEFMNDQYSEDIPGFESVLTLTGSALYAQASTCANYIKTTWPFTGTFFLKLLDAIRTSMVRSDAKRPDQISLTSDEGLSVVADVFRKPNSASLATFTAHAIHEDLLVHFAQQLSWLSSAFTTSPSKKQLAYSSPSLRRIREGLLEITTNYELIDESEKACWLPLFDGACIVAGFPISARAEEIGLEISLDLLARLSGARHVVEYEGGLVMKGFSHMFVPVRRQLDRVQWHALSSSDEETALSYQDGISRCNSRAMLHEVGLQDLTSLRAIVGWCSVATVCLGSSHADYENIDYTQTEEANSGLRCTGGSLGFQQFGVAALDVKFGSKDGKSHFHRSGPYQRILQFAEGSPIVLHDVKGKQSWLVPATNVMLHIVQHRHRLEPFQANGKIVSLDTNIASGSSAKEVLLNNRTQLLFEDDEHTFMDEILNIWSLLEFLLAQNVNRQRETPGVRIPSSVHESIYGFEFKSIVHQDPLYKLKKTTISRNHGGWLKLIEDIDALVLFANGFGDVIQPAGGFDNLVCHKWRRVPDGQDYFTTTTDMLQRLFDKAGSRRDRKYLTTKSKLRWHQGSSTLFNACRNVALCDCTRLQQLVPESAFRNVQPPNSIASEGAVIFGRPNPRPAPPRPTEPQISSSLYSQPNIPITTSVILRRDSLIDRAMENIRQLDIEIHELGCERNRRLQAIGMY